LLPFFLAGSGGGPSRRRLGTLALIGVGIGGTTPARISSALALFTGGYLVASRCARQLEREAEAELQERSDAWRIAAAGAAVASSRASEAIVAFKAAHQAAVEVGQARNTTAASELLDVESRVGC